MDKIIPQNNQNNVLTLKASEQAVFKDFVAPKNTQTVSGFLTQPKDDEFKSDEDKKRSKIAKKAIVASVGLALLGILISPKFLPKSLTNKLKMDSKKIFDGVAQKIEPVTKKANILNNFNTAKDAAIKKLFSLIPPLKRFDDASSRLYIKMSSDITLKKYTKTLKAIEELQSKTKNGEVQELCDNAIKAIKKNFGKDALEKYKGELDVIFDGIDGKYREKTIGQIKKKDFRSLCNFTIEDMVKKDKIEVGGKLAKKAQSVQDYLDKIAELSDDKNLAQKIQKKFTNAVNTQGNDFFDKYRDIKVGAAPSDAAGLVTSAAGLGIYSAQADSKEERTSVALTTGIPLGLGILGSIVATTKMISGFNALAIGMATSLISGTLGKKFDKIYKKKHGIEDKPATIPTLKLPKATQSI